MPTALVFAPGSIPNTVRAADGTVQPVPAGWVLLPPGDAGLTRRVKAVADTWAVQEKRGRKVFSRGVWVAAEVVERVRAELDAERATPAFAKRRQQDAARRERVQAEYVEAFHAAVVAYLAFHPVHAEVADRLARLVTAHATPVGSGTVARTKRIPVQQRAEAAVIAWMRHQTTAYDSMVIPRVKGKRREMRRLLARRSVEVLASYRRGEPVREGCVLGRALHPSRLRDAQVAADFAGEGVGDLGVSGHGGPPAVRRVAPPGVPPPLTDQPAPVPPQMSDQIDALHVPRLTSS